MKSGVDTVLEFLEKPRAHQEWVANKHGVNPDGLSGSQIFVQVALVVMESENPPNTGQTTE